MFLLPATRHVAAGPSVKYWLSLFTSADDAAAVWLLSPRSVSSLLLLCLFNGTVGAALEGFVRCSLLLTFLGPCVYCSLCLERLVKRYAPSLIFQQDSVSGRYRLSGLCKRFKWWKGHWQRSGLQCLHTTSQRDRHSVFESLWTLCEASGQHGDLLELPSDINVNRLQWLWIWWD